MKILLAVYHDIHTEARTQELLDCSSKMGETIFISYSKIDKYKNVKSIVTGRGKKRYFPFVFKVIKYIKKVNPDIVILHDNYTAIILWWMKVFRKRNFIIYDSSELYIDLKPKKFKHKIAMIMQYIENKYLKFANIVIAANEERARIMKRFFKLKNKPIVFDNIHKINENYDIVLCEKKYKKIFNNKFVILYGGGIGERRMTYELATAIGELKEDFYLIITGSSTKEEQKKFEAFIQMQGFNNIIYLGFVPREEFKYLLQNSKISVSAFDDKTLNNKYCASGKVYESLFENTPVLTTENPPFRNLCNTYKVGVCNNDFKKGILTIRNNYMFYKKNIRKFISSVDYESRVTKLSEKILEIYSDYNEKNTH